jgi:hypothetical protein
MAKLFLIVLLACSCSLVHAGKAYTVEKAPGNFTLASVRLTSERWNWGEGVVANVIIEGTTAKTILAGTFYSSKHFVNFSFTSGTVKWQLYEAFVPSFVAQGDAPYFTCDNKGCNPQMPIALKLSHPELNGIQSYKLSFTYTMPASEKSGDFHLVVWGVDQDHTPYDFSATIGYNYTKF